MHDSVNRPGMTLLETLVALVILGLVVVSGLQLLGETRQLTGQADAWARAVVYAEEGLDQALLSPVPTGRRDSLADGFARRVEVQPWEEPGVLRVDVTVTWPDDGRFRLTRLIAP